MAKTRKKLKKTKHIIEGFLEKVSAKIFDKYQKEITEMIRGHQGLYALYRKNKLYYVGLASNLKNRIRHHLKDRHQGEWTHFSLYIIRKADYIKELESLLIRIAYPEGNSVKGKLKQSKNYLPKLKAYVKSKIKAEYEDLFRGDRAATEGIKNIKSDGEKPLQGLLRHYQPIYGRYKGILYKANVFKSGIIKLNGKLYLSPTGAAKNIIDRGAVNGWNFWKYKDRSGKLIKIANLRK